MGLKLNIRKVNPEEPDGFEVLFNPNTYTITKPVTWSPPRPPTGPTEETHATTNAPMLLFGGGGSRILTVELFFDVTELGGVIDDVRVLTNEIMKLTLIDQKTLPHPQPPTCLVTWGTQPKGSDFPFLGVVSNLVQRFTLFRRTGEPVRATLTVTFTEFLDPVVDLHGTDPELSTRVVKRGDTLSGIAGEVYRDPTRWRVIAEANGLDDPRKLVIGATLGIPKSA
jgi:nucleoid-associated protein YgaU